MKKILFILVLASLSGCASEKQGYRVIDNNTPDALIRQEIEVVPSENIETQPDEFREDLQNFKDLPANQDISKRAFYMESLVQKLKKETAKNGIQVKVVENQLDLIMPNKVVFGGYQTKVQDSFENTLSSIAQILKEYDQTMIQVIGYTDEAGSVLANQDLSLQKANIIADFLKSYGIEPARIITDGAGANNPISTDKTPKGREANRRVEMTLISLQ